MKYLLSILLAFFVSSQAYADKVGTYQITNYGDGSTDVYILNTRTGEIRVCWTRRSLTHNGRAIECFYEEKWILKEK